MTYLASELLKVIVSCPTTKTVLIPDDRIALFLSPVLTIVKVIPQDFNHRFTINNIFKSFPSTDYKLQSLSFNQGVNGLLHA